MNTIERHNINENRELYLNNMTEAEDDLTLMNVHEVKHLEEEFENYKELYPYEAPELKIV